MSLKFLETIAELSRDVADLKARVAALEARMPLPPVGVWTPDAGSEPTQIAGPAQPLYVLNDIARAAMIEYKTTGINQPRKRGRPRKVIANG